MVQVHPTGPFINGGYMSAQEFMEYVSSAEFKLWYGDWNNVTSYTYKSSSKIIDNNGLPFLVYHGTNRYDIIERFRPGKRGTLGPGIYFTNSIDHAHQYSNKGGGVPRIYVAFIRITNPVIISGDGTEDLLKAIYGHKGVYERRSRKQANDVFMINSRDILKLKRSGFDGIIWDHPYCKEYVVWDGYNVKIMEIMNG